MRFIITIWRYLASLPKRDFRFASDSRRIIRPAFFAALFAILFLTTVDAAIPLPNTNAMQSKGLNAGMALGTIANSRCKTLWTWTAQTTYFYNSFFSGGVGVKFFGGNLDSANNLVYQRYSLQGFFSADREKFVIFLGPAFSFDNTSLSALRDKIYGIGGDEESAEAGENERTECREIFDEIGFNIGYRAGLGFLITPVWGFTMGHTLDLTFKGTYIASFSGSLAFSLREFSQRLLDNTQNLYLSLEYSTSFIKFSHPMHTIMLGFMVGF